MARGRAGLIWISGKAMDDLNDDIFFRAGLTSIKAQPTILRLCRLAAVARVMPIGRDRVLIGMVARSRGS